MSDILSTTDLFFHLFPFGILVDHEGKIIKQGKSILKVMPTITGENLLTYIKLGERKSSVSFPGPLQMFSLGNEEGSIKIRGQLLPLEQGYFFTGEMGVNSTEVLKEFGLNFKDFSNQDNIFHFLMLLGSQEHSIEQLQNILNKLKFRNKLSSLVNEVALELDEVTNIDDVFVLTSMKLLDSFPQSSLLWSKVKGKQNEDGQLTHSSFETVFEVDKVSGKATSRPEKVGDFALKIELYNNNNFSMIELAGIDNLDCHATLRAIDGEDFYYAIISIGRDAPVLNQEEQVFNLISRLMQSKISALSNEKQKNEMLLQRIHLGRIAMLGELSAGVAHEINNPLAIISLIFEKININIVEDNLYSKYQKDFEIVRNSIDRIVKIIKGLKSYVRGGASDRHVSTPVKNLFEDTWVLMQSKYKQLGVDYKYEIEDESLVITCGPVQIVQILTNLLSNSADAVSGLPVRSVKMSCKAYSGIVRFEVRDSGRLIPKEIVDKLMNPFFTTKDPGKGTGLGLSLSQTIATQHKGRLFLDQEKEETCFVLELPI